MLSVNRSNIFIIQQRHNEVSYIEKILLFVVLFIGEISYTQAQQTDAWNYPITTYGISEGLSQSQVIKILVDRKGYLWFGTKVGVNRFNGIDFENYLSNPIFPRFYIEDIRQTSNGSVWMASGEGLLELNENKLINHSEELSGSQIKPNELAVDSSGAVFFINTIHRDTIWSLKDGVVTPYLTSSLEDSFYSSLAVLPNSNTVVSVLSDRKKRTSTLTLTRDGISRIHRTTDIRFLRTFTASNQNVYTYHLDTIFRITEDGLNVAGFHPLSWLRDVDNVNGKLCVANFDSLFLQENDSWENLGGEYNGIRDIATTEDGNIWLATEGGVQRVNLGEFKIYSQENSLEAPIWGVVEDNGVLLLPTHGGGLLLLDSSNYKREEVAIQGNIVTRFYMGATKLDNGKVLLPYEFGTIVKDGNHYYQMEEDSKQATFGYLQIDSSQLYICSGDLIRIDNPFTNTVKTTILEEAGKGYFLDAELDNNGNVWASTINRLVRVSKDSITDFDDPELDTRGAITIHRDFNDNLWFGGKDGLSLLNNESSFPRPIFRNIINRQVGFLESISDKYLLVGSLGGLYIVDIEDSFSLEHPSWELISKNRGFEGMGGGQLGIEKSGDKVWMLTSDGLIEFDYTSYDIPRITVDVIFDRYSKSTEERSISTIFLNANHHIEFSTSEQNLVINFDCLNYTFTRDIKFRTFLAGYDQNWSTATNRRSVEYTTLAAGHYDLNVQAIFQGKVIGEQSIAIVVSASSFWDTRLWVNYGYYILMIFSAILLFWQYQKRKKAEEAELKKKLHNVQLQNELIYSHVDDHFLFNTLNDVSSIISSGRIDEATVAISRLSTLLRPIFSSSNSILTTIGEEISLIKNYLELQKLGRPDKFSQTIEIQQDVSLQSNIPRLLIQSFVGNALKHGLAKRKQGGIIRIEISLVDRFFIIRILDNGTGYAPLKTRNRSSGSGNGIALAKESLRLMDAKHKVTGSTIRIEKLLLDQEYPGTQVEIRCFAHYENEISDA